MLLDQAGSLGLSACRPCRLSPPPRAHHLEPEVRHSANRQTYDFMARNIRGMRSEQTKKCKPSVSSHPGFAVPSAASFHLNYSCTKHLGLTQHQTHPDQPWPTLTTPPCRTLVSRCASHWSQTFPNDTAVRSSNAGSGRCVLRGSGLSVPRCTCAQGQSSVTRLCDAYTCLQTHQATRAMAQGFSLGAAVFPSLQPAPGCAEPQQHAPDTVLDLLLTQHGAVVYAGLSAASKAGKTWSLQHAPKATLTLRPDPDAPFETAVPRTSQEAADWEQRLSIARDALSVRGALPTTLRLLIEDTSDLLAVPEYLAGVGEGIVRIEVVYQGTSNMVKSTSTAAFLQAAAQACPNVTSLHLVACPCVLPPSPAFPKLTHFSLRIFHNCPAGSVFRSIAQYLPQITHLVIDIPEIEVHDEPGHEPWPKLFTAAHRTTTLTHCTLTVTLTDELAVLLISHAPSITHLTVEGLQLAWQGEPAGWGGDPNEIDLTEREWSVEVLRVARAGVDGGRLALLPRRRGDGQVEVRAEELKYQVTTGEQPNDPLQHRLSDWHFTVDKIVLQSGDGNEYISAALPANQQPAALRNVLRQLQGVQVTQTTPVTLMDWACVGQLAAIVFDGAPLLPQLQLGHYEYGTLTDDLVRAMVALAPVRSLTVGELDLDSDHSHLPWPWERLYVAKMALVDRVPLTDMVKLPSPAGDGAPRRVQCSALDITENVLKISVLSAVCFNSPESEALAHICLQGWVMDRDALGLLAGLPSLACSLEFRECEWPLHASAYKVLGVKVPVKYTRWRLGDVPRAVYECVKAAVTEHRRTLGLKPLCM